MAGATSGDFWMHWTLRGLSGLQFAASKYLRFTWTGSSWSCIYQQKGLSAAENCCLSWRISAVSLLSVSLMTPISFLLWLSRCPSSSWTAFGTLFPVWPADRGFISVFVMISFSATTTAGPPRALADATHSSIPFRTRLEAWFAFFRGWGHFYRWVAWVRSTKKSLKGSSWYHRQLVPSTCIFSGCRGCDSGCQLWFYFSRSSIYNFIIINNIISWCEQSFQNMEFPSKGRCCINCPIKSEMWLNCIQGTIILT